MNRLGHRLRSLATAKLALGAPLIVASVAVAASLILAWGVRPAIGDARSMLLRQQVAGLDALQQQAAARPVARDAREAFRDEMPARSAASIAAERIAPGLLRQRLRLDIRADYRTLRREIADRLNTQPNLALDRIELSAADDGSGRLTARLEFSAYVRQETP